MKKTIVACMIVLLMFTFYACKTNTEPMPSDTSKTGNEFSPTSTQGGISLETKNPEVRGDIIEDDPSGGRGDIVEGDPGEEDVPNWWGEFTSDEFSIGITNFNGSSFHFSIFLLRNGSTVFEGIAVLYPDNDHMAEYMDTSFSLYDDNNAIDFFTSDNSEWKHMRGNYQRTE